MQPISGEINVVAVHERGHFLLTLVNIYRLLLIMKHAVPDYEERERMRPGYVWRRDNFTSLTPSVDKIVKRIVDFENYDFTSFDALRAAYAAAAASCQYLIHGVPVLETSGDLVVELRPVGFVDPPRTEEVSSKYEGWNVCAFFDSSSCTRIYGLVSRRCDKMDFLFSPHFQDLAELVFAACSGAAALHLANIVHRDIRLPNFVRVVGNNRGRGHYILIDFEHCAYANMVPKFWLSTWGADVLDGVPGGAPVYSQRSDCYAIGRLMAAVEARGVLLSSTGQELRDQLLAKSVTAIEALAHPWLQQWQI